ncbi:MULTISPECIES: PBSX family phage terminase large subunit [unclassified Nocardia]|uniref:PBSX family phage terminase large subunit n=1 Tax=unclassified Nocardia TaxID=2637762 RepID=UPI00278BFBD2|nr:MULTISPECIES: PBSX family phage terminase large subunit [unclassified Nocardia]
MTAARQGMSRKQLLSYAQAVGRVNIFEGAIRSGKSFSWTWLLLHKVATAGPIGSIVIVGRSRLSVWRNVFEPLFQVPVFAMFAKHVHYKQGAPTAKIFGREVHVFGADDVTSENAIRGMTVQLAFLDELTVLHVEFFKQMLGRMSVEGAQLFATTNPDNPQHWLRTEYLNRLAELPDWRVFHFVLDDNPSLSEEYKASVRREYSGLWYRRFILGEWVAAEGAIFDMWDEKRHVVAWEKMPPITDWIGVGIDYGTTNATAVIAAGIGADGRLYLTDEWRFEASEKSMRATDSQLSKGIREWLVQPHAPIPEQGAPPSAAFEDVPVIADPAAASLRVQLIADDQFTYPANNDVLYGIRLMASLLGADMLRVSDRCAGFITEVTGYSWDPKATAVGKDAPLKVHDHSLDAARYALVTTERRWRSLINFPSSSKDTAA